MQKCHCLLYYACDCACVALVVELFQINEIQWVLFYLDVSEL